MARKLSCLQPVTSLLAMQDELNFQDTGPYAREIEEELAEGLWEQLAAETERAMSSASLKRRVDLTGVLASAIQRSA